MSLKSEIVLLAAGGISLGYLFGPALAVLLSFLEKTLKRVWDLLFSLVFVTKEIHGDGEEMMIQFLFHHSPLKNLGSDRFTLRRVFVRPLSDWFSVWFRATGVHWRWGRYRGAPVMFLPSEGLSRIVYLRGTVKIEDLLKEVASYHHDYVKATNRPERRFAVVRYAAGGAKVEKTEAENNPKAIMKTGGEEPLGWRADELGVSAEGSRVTDLSLTPEMKRLLRNVRFWHEHETWFKERQIPWRRGFLLHGPPGGGKTSVTRAIAEEIDFPVHQFDLTGMDNASFISCWQHSRRSGSRIVLFEDFDSVFHGRTNLGGDKSKLTFDCVLNTLDGIEREDGLLLIVTTNHPEHIDPAMGVPDEQGRSTRPGRIDMTIGFGPLSHPGRVKICQRILLDPDQAEALARQGHDDSPAQLVERCIQFAQKDLWERYEDKEAA